MLAGTLPPNEIPTYIETWQEMGKPLEEHPGKSCRLFFSVISTVFLDRVKHIGVSNFNIAKLEELAAKAKVKPATNQVRIICDDNSFLQPT